MREVNPMGRRPGEWPEADGFDASGSVRNGECQCPCSLCPAQLRSGVPQLTSKALLLNLSSLSSSWTASTPHNRFYHHALFLASMNIFLWSLALLLVASSSRAIRVPVSRFKLPSLSPLQKRVQGPGGTPYNVLATTDSSNDDLKSVHFPDDPPKALMCVK